MANTITIKARTSDLNGAAEAAAEHFRQVGVSRSTVQTFVTNCHEAGIRVGRDGNTLILFHGAQRVDRRVSARSASTSPPPTGVRA